jgi:alpha-beta hydrolase superfamily lysophospholipase
VLSRALLRLLRRGAALALVAAATLLAMRAWDAQRGPPLRPWHRFVPAELRADRLDAADWARYLAAEDAALAAVRAEVSARLEEEDRVPSNRYDTASPVNPAGFAQDWNRSFVLAPEGGEPVGAAVLLHGMTDAPFSLRHVARSYRDRGWVAVAIRLPGHGTVPAGLTDVAWEDWMAATRLAVREARARVGPSRPLHLVGYSNGGALALKYAMDAIDDGRLPRADRVVLISPMVGVTAFARFAGLAALPALLPAFAKAAWLEVLPEYNPFKYNSFPVNAARQSHRLTAALQAQIGHRAGSGALARMPPVLAFQSVVDFTVSTPAVLTALYAHLPQNGSEVVLFDLNRNAGVGPLLDPAAAGALERLLPPGPQPFRRTVVANAHPGTDEVVERSTGAGAAAEAAVRPLGLSYPRGVFSLSHIALPFPVEDGLYGLRPDPADRFGVHLGAVAPRGERGVLVLGLDALMRLSSNPFFPYLIARIEEAMEPPESGGRGGAAGGAPGFGMASASRGRLADPAGCPNR